MADFPEHIRAEFERDERVVRVREYLDGFVPNSYFYRAPGTYREYLRDGTQRDGTYDRKRSGGKGRALVAYSAAGGVL